ncbi:MAG: AtpZ/AtpI family protein [Chloroflexi bacterium]|nr:AtpZ/AtpI family protein [Chloroflexota bacterium]MDA1239659.1 AtpZ/AtpI family protein [Chloroflexota bacterium]MQC25521.1 AtpZ/AtpI family protein [Chloroflexota bacterium]MQC47740.1 AtpZ/AtpI family protein [Chloroflexota bacterium]
MMNSPAFGLLGLGLSLAFWIVGGAWLGNYLDGRFDTRPALTLVFLVLGLAIGFYDAYRRLKDVIERVERQRRRKGR